MTTPDQDLDSLYRSSLATHQFSGGREWQWNELTDVKIDPSNLGAKSAEVYHAAKIPEYAELREALLAQLLKYVVELHFTKVNGEPTIMLCTLYPGWIPVEERSKLKLAQEQIPLSLGQLLLEVDPMATLQRLPVKAEDPNLIKVWSTDRNGWRAFKLNKVTRILVHQDGVQT